MAEHKQILVIHGPNLNLLGTREPEVYGHTTLEEIDARLASLATELGYAVTSFQSNGEGELVTRIQQASADSSAILINPGAYTHTSVAIRDAILAAGLVTVEVHLSNIHKREEFRRRSLLSDVVAGQVMGFGAASYALGLRAIVGLLDPTSD